MVGLPVARRCPALEGLRTTFCWKADNLDAAGLQTRVGASSLILAALLKHLALVEGFMFTTKLRGDLPGEPWDSTSLVSI